jgi:hypothetical protein
MSDKVIPFRPKDPIDAAARADHARIEGKPQCVLDPATGCYDIVVDHVVVIGGLDLIGAREWIAKQGREEIARASVAAMIEPQHYGPIRSAASWMRHLGESTCTVTLWDGSTATLTVSAAPETPASEKDQGT